MSIQGQDQEQQASVASLGERLRQGRTARGMSAAEVGERLRLPAAIIEAMERDDFERLGATIYARGHLNGYVRLLGLPGVLVDSALADRVPPAPLVTTSSVPRAHYLFDRYARRAVYVVLTASIVLPVVWLATRDQLPGHSAITASLDSAPTAVEGAAPAQPVAADVPAASVEERQVVASMAPFYRESARAAEPAPPLQGPVLPEPETALEIEFVGPSWVEVLGKDGKRLAFGLVAAGEAQSFPLHEVASVSIGDADAVDVSMGGREVDLAPYRRAKVARFTLSSDGKLNPAGG